MHAIPVQNPPFEEPQFHEQVGKGPKFHGLKPNFDQTRDPAVPAVMVTTKPPVGFWADSAPIEQIVDW